MPHIYLIRHGQASFGTADYDRLSERGRRQSLLLGGYWRRTGLRFDAFYAGPLRRHLETARHAMAALAPGEDPASPRIIEEFEEIDTDRILAAQRGRLLADHPHLTDAYRRRHRDADAFRRVLTQAMQQNLAEASASSADDVFGRFVSSVRRGLWRVVETAADATRVAVFTSGGTIAAAVQSALNLDPAVALELGWQILNTSVSVIETGRERVGLNAFNLTAHLDLEADGDLKTLF